ncbi:uncharacterized protein [Nicotiana sylvestris]|uniref:uncharacterized protein n=1 Tax=Nicotiana sylvestris TaxID=4096 RepID=UPI00388C9658
MASTRNLPIIGPDDSPTSAILQLESAAAEENKRLRLRILKMWDTWSNGREPPSAIHGFPELIPRSGEVTNSPFTNPLIPCGHPPMPSNDPDMPSTVRPQAPASRTQPPMFIFHGPQLQSKIAYVTPYSFTQPPQYDLSVEKEKVVKNPEQEEMARKMKSLEQILKNMQGLSRQKSVSYSDLCIFPHVHLPAGFKTPKFEKYDGHVDPVAHLKRYCNQLRGAGGKEELLTAYFGETSPKSLLSDIAPDRISLSILKKKIMESFREYAVKWHEQAARAQEADYFQNMMSVMGKPFAEAIKIGKMVENGLKMGRILSHVSFKAISPDVHNGSEDLINGKRREEGVMMPVAPNRLNPESPLHRVDARCEYHFGAVGHSTEDWWTLKRAVEDLIEAERIIFQDEEALDVMNNLLLAHNSGPIVGMICEDKEFDLPLKAIAAIAKTEEKLKNDRQA